MADWDVVDVAPAPASGGWDVVSSEPAKAATPESSGWSQFDDTFNRYSSAGLVGGATKSIARAVGHPFAPDADTTVHNLPTAAGAVAGSGVSLANDTLAMLLSGGQFPELAAGAAAAPKAAGALYGGATEALQQLGSGDTGSSVGQVGRVAGAAAGGGLLAGLPGWFSKGLESKPWKAFADTVKGHLPGGSETAATDIASATRQVAGEDARGAQRLASDAQQGAQAAQGAIGQPSDPVASGSQFQHAMKGHVDALDKAREQATEPLYDEARKTAKGTTPDLTEIRTKLQALQPNTSIEQSRRLSGLFSQVEGSLSPTQVQTPTGILGIPQTSTAPPVAPYDHLRELSRSLELTANEAEKAGDGSLYAKALAAKSAVGREMDRITGGMHGKATAKFAEMSEPINALMEPGGDNLIKLQAYMRHPDPKDNLRGFTMAPEQVPDKLFGMGDRGGQIVKRALGGQAVPFVRGEVARRVQGLNGRQLRSFMDDNGTFLTHFPEVRGDLLKAQQATTEAEIRQTASEQAVEAAIKGQLPIDPGQAREAIHGYISGNNVEGLRRALEASRRVGGDPHVGRDAVAQYFRGKLDPILDHADKDTLPSIGGALQGIAEEWSGKRQLLIESSALTPSQAADIDRVMTALSDVGRNAKVAARRSDATVIGPVLHAVGHKLGGAPVGIGMAARGISERNARTNAQRILTEAIQDPAMARDLALRLKGPDAHATMLQLIEGPFLQGDPDGNQ